MRIAASLVLLSLIAAAAEPPSLTLTHERVVVFKDGYALVVKQAVGRSNANGVVVTDEVPDAAILGSFWAIPEDGRLLSMTAETVETVQSTDVTVRAGGYADLFALNPGRTVNLLLDDGTRMTGTVRAVLGNQIVVLQGGEQQVTVPLVRIRELSMDEMTLDQTVNQVSRSTRKRLTFRFEGGEAERRLTLLYFRPGLRWIPSYRIELPRDDAQERRARVVLQGELLNEAEDLVQVPIDLVVGVPNFRFREVVSPFVLEPALRRALQEAAPQLMGQTAMSNAYFASRGGERQREETGPQPFAVPDELAGGGTQDLFVYSLPPMDLRRGARAAVPILDGFVDVAHVYTWEVAVLRSDQPVAAADLSPLRISAERVWHQLELVNDTGSPWTTGPALLLQDGKPLAQELLTYTPRGASVRVPVTVAVDVRGAYGSEETGRTPGALNWAGYRYMRIDEKGTLTVTNHKAEAVTVEVSCRIGGKIDEAGEGAEIVIQPFRSEDWSNYRGHPAANNSSLLRWRRTITPGTQETLDFQSHHFVRE